MLRLIADSGSTKTDWVLMDKTSVLLRQPTMGFNPYFQNAQQISLELEQKLIPQLHDFKDSIAEVHYYGAGCSTPEKCQIVSQGINAVLPGIGINVAHDLLAAARALCGRQKGIAAILGTGSNSCLYDGEKIVENVPSVGYLWSDYGGGSQIGKFFIRDYFEGRLPAHLSKAFEAAGYNREVILDNVYKGGVPSRYLATVSLFISRHLQEEAVQTILRECFTSFFEQQIGKYTHARQYPVHTVGSVGFYFKNSIAAVAAGQGFKMGTVIRSPMEGLLAYHSSY